MKELKIARLERLSSRARALAVSALLVGAASCEDATSVSPTRTADGTPASTAAKSRPESAELQGQDTLAANLARAMARGLDRPPLREKLRRAMRATLQREHKLDVRGYLASSEGQQLSAAVAAQLSLTRAGLTQLLDSLPQLEMYLPVREHRAAWRGGQELIVAAGLHEGEAPRGFALDGTPVALSATAAPAQPVLILTKNETDFNQQVDAGAWENQEDAGGAAIGTMIRRGGAKRGASIGGPTNLQLASKSRGRAGESKDIATAMLIVPCEDCIQTQCEPCDPPPPPPPPPVRGPGVWLESIHFNDYEEPWYRGTAEITVLLSGPGMNGFEGATLSCGGQYATSQAQHDAGYKYFDQSGHDWSRQPYLLEGLLFGQADLNEFGTLYQNNVPASIEFWEDDDGGANCHYNGGVDGAQEMVNDLTNAYHVVSQVIAILAVPVPTIQMSIALALSIRQLFGSGNDIILGRAINVRLPDGSFSQTQYRLIRRYTIFGIYRGLQDNGYANLTIIQP